MGQVSILDALGFFYKKNYPKIVSRIDKCTLVVTSDSLGSISVGMVFNVHFRNAIHSDFQVLDWRMMTL